VHAQSTMCHALQTATQAAQGRAAAAQTRLSLHLTEHQVTACRPSIQANTPVMFDVQLLYIPGEMDPAAEAEATAAAAAAPSHTRPTAN
jgi:hypothetical protein